MEWATLKRDRSAQPIEVPESSGQPIEPAARSFLEARLGHDLKRVRVHTDRAAARSAQAKNARAYAVGRDIVFGAHQYDPHSEAGRRLLAHEVTHAIQQDLRRASSTDRVAENQSVTHEREATEISRTIVDGSITIAPRITRTAQVQLAADKKPAGWDEMHNYKHPGNVVVGLTIFKTTGMTKDFVARYVEVAKKMLKEHGLGLDVYTHATKLDWTLPLQTIEQVLELRMLGHKAYQDDAPAPADLLCADALLDAHDRSDFFQNRLAAVCGDQFRRGKPGWRDVAARNGPRRRCAGPQGCAGGQRRCGA